MTITTDRLARHAKLYGTEGIFPAAVDALEGRELVRLAAILRRSGWRPSKDEQARIEVARRSECAGTPISEFCSTSGWAVLDPHGERVHSVANGDLDLAADPSRNGSRGVARCEVCGRPLKVKRSTRRYCNPTCRSRAHRQDREVV